MNDDPNRIDRVLQLLTSKERRRIIEYFHHVESDTATVEVLSAHLGRLRVEAGGTEAESTDGYQNELHHVHLPKMQDYGIVEYDPRSGHVRYRSDDQAEAITEFLTEL
ncbi:DUF7344 domain-containing protein [Halorussus caseinilyticus]|uniref:DUF7344 domain-containing protein n=1 Tax=Halorussus caseinilyticus TaxID=3034025 RepID=A0ABD5WEA1_9EURY|nr:hypothetical protein [Halorussus sp. DT72]